MTIRFQKTFTKQYHHLQPKQQQAVDRAIRRFSTNPRISALRLHALKGHFKNTYSISAGGDLRLHFVIAIPEPKVVVFVAVGTHAQLYE